MGTVLLKFIVGAIAGLVAWMIFEPAAPKDHAAYIVSNWEDMFVLGLGGLVGLAVGGLDGFTRGGKVHTLRGAGLGLVFGGIGMAFGHATFGGIIAAVFGPLAFNSGNIVITFLPRILAFAGMGACLGAAIGASSINPKKIFQGAIGGVIGGALAGMIFDPLSKVLSDALLSSGGGNEVGGPGRAVMAVLLGGAIALFIGIVDRISRSAWLRLNLGRNEGKEWVIDSGQTFIGRKEGVHVPLFGDNNVAPIHASIQKHGGQYILIDGGSPIGTLLNGQRVAQAPLFHGAIIQIGSFALQFLMKHGAAPVRGSEAQIGQPYAMAQAPQPQQMPTAAWQPAAMPASGPAMPMSMPTQAIPTQASQPTMAYQPSGISLLAIDGPLMGQKFTVGQSFDVGRECPTIPMSFDTAASRKHANLAPAPGGVSVTDLGSTNGTFINGQRVSQAFARIGDLLKIGSTTFRVEA
jgi:pSer/pThr/pTyr-binding forkhead associated (FHA) protein